MKTFIGRTAAFALAMAALTLQAGAAHTKGASKTHGAAAAMPKKAVCPVCSLNESKKSPEDVKVSARYKGKTYYFCSPGCKAAFLKNPARYAARSK